MYQRASHAVKPGALQHPLQGACEELMRNSPELYKIWQQVHAQARTIGKKTPALVSADIVSWAKEKGIYDRLRNNVVTFLDKEKVARDGVKQLNLKPPKSAELYERVDPKEKVVDVGVGDGKRLVRYVGYFGSVRGVDIVKKPMVSGWPVNWQVDIAIFAGTDDIVTSFLSYTQVDTRVLKSIEESDGIHVVPNHEALRKLGVVKDLLGGNIECSMGDHVFIERDLGNSGGENLRSYYQGINTYKQREVEFNAKARSKFEPPGRRYFMRMERDLFVDEFTPKYAGTFMELKSVKGKFTLKDSLGKGVWGLCNAPDMILHLEALKDGFVLLRVEKYRGFRPYHSLGMLEKFCSRVKIKLIGKKVRPPERIKDIRSWREECPGADGVVCRDNGMDYVMNCGIHLDLRAEKIDELTGFLRDKIGAKTVEHLGSRDPGCVHEVCVIVNDKGYGYCRWHRRIDKEREDACNTWRDKFKLLTIEKFLLKHENGIQNGSMVWDEDDGTDD